MMVNTMRSLRSLALTCVHIVLLLDRSSYRDHGCHQERMPFQRKGQATKQGRPTAGLDMKYEILQSMRESPKPYTSGHFAAV